jgi:hypothetical protein
MSAGTILEKITAVNSSTFQYTFSVSGFDFLQGEALDIQFDPSVYFSLLNPIAPGGFSVITLQPNNPPGAPGDYIIEGLMGTQSLSGPSALAISSTLAGANQPGPLPFFIYQVDSNGNFGNVVGSGTTTILAAATPEPFNFSLAGLGLLAAGISRVLKRWR